MSKVVRGAALAEARLWIGTPYRHQASLRGVGTDCLGLIRGIWRALHGPNEPESPPNYTPDWAERSGRETLLDAANRWLIPTGKAQPGDVLVFRVRSGMPCKHVGILAPDDRLIHAFWGHAVFEDWLQPFWARRAAYAFSYPSFGEFL